MGSNFRLKRLDIFASVAAIVTTGLFLGAALDAAGAYASVRTMSGSEIVIGCFGWLLATFGPLAICVTFWKWSQRHRRPWILHLLMGPLAFASVRGGASLMLLVIGDPDFDATLGGPVLQAGVLFIAAVGGYYAAVINAMIVKSRERADGG